MDVPPSLYPAIAASYAGMSVIAVAAFWLDKRLAVRGARRIPERTLHLIELFGGWPGALLAQRIFRHKRGKPGFYLVTWLIVALHVAAWVLWALARNR
jgi:uncharacterized membrane protein YsdA (DUF1294 family)